MRSFPTLISGLAVWLAAQAAWGQTDFERATARDAANSGRAAFDAGQYEKAIDSFSRAESLVHAPPHLLFLARAQAKLGRLVAAHETYLKITRETLTPKAPKAFLAAQDAAEDELGGLEGRLPSVTVTLKGAPPDGVVVEMDGMTLPPAMVGIPVPADPGKHVFKVSGTATGDPVTISLAEGAKQSVVLKVRVTASPARPPAPTPTPPPVPAAPPASGAASAPAPAPREVASPTEPVDGHREVAVSSTRSGGPSALRVVSYVSLGVGIVGLGVGTYYMVQAKNSDNAAASLFARCATLSHSVNCDRTVLTPEQLSQYDSKDSDAKSQQKIGIAALIGGGVGVAVGLTFLVLDATTGNKSAERSTPHVTPVIGINSVGLVGTF